MRDEIADLVRLRPFCKRKTGFCVDFAVHLKQLVFRIFPNPASDLVNVEWIGMPTGSEGQIILLDLSGHEVIRKNLLFDKKKLFLETKQLPSGAYWCKIMVDGAEMYAERIVLIK